MRVPRDTLVVHIATPADLVPGAIGGADVASELDAKRAIDQGTRLAASL